MRRLLVPASFFLLSLSASAGLIPPSQTQIDVASYLPDTGTLTTDDLGELPLTLTEAMQQLSLFVDQTLGVDLGLKGDRIFVLVGDGSATSVHTVARRFRTRGTVLEPVSTLEDSSSRVDPFPEIATLTNYDGQVLDPALLGKVAAAVRSVGSGKQYELPLMTMSDGPFIIGGGAAGLWALLGLVKTLKNRSRRASRRVKVRSHRH